MLQHEARFSLSLGLVTVVRLCRCLYHIELVAHDIQIFPRVNRADLALRVTRI